MRRYNAVLGELHYVYSIKDQDGKCFYIGATHNPIHRLSLHRHSTSGANPSLCGIKIKSEEANGRPISMDILHMGDRDYCLRKEQEEILKALSMGEPLVNRSMFAVKVHPPSTTYIDDAYVTIKMSAKDFSEYGKFIYGKSFKHEFGIFLKELHNKENKL